MVILLVALAIAGGGYLLLRTRVKEVAAPGLPIPTPAPALEPVVLLKLHYSVGDVLIHNETRQKVTIMRTPSILDEEYAIKWPNGELGYIHEAQLIDWFTRA